MPKLVSSGYEVATATILELTFWHQQCACPSTGILLFLKELLILFRLQVQAAPFLILVKSCNCKCSCGFFL